MSIQLIGVAIMHVSKQVQLNTALLLANLIVLLVILVKVW